MRLNHFFLNRQTGADRLTTAVAAAMLVYISFRFEWQFGVGAVATIPLALFGGGALQEFAWVLLFGVVPATSSSIFIAAPILLFLGEHRLRRNPAAAASR